ncbi:MAG: hypothetical protein GY950_36250 [bacterium]|nr:hypothetical protein [bacterium]
MNPLKVTRETRLGDLVEIVHGRAFSGAFFSNAPTSHVLLTPANFRAGGGFNPGRFKYYRHCHRQVPRQYILEPGDIIIALTDLSRDSDILGCAARIPRIPREDSNAAVKYLHNQRIGRITLLSPDIIPGFLYWVLQSKPYLQHVLGDAHGSTVKHTSPGHIKNFRFLLPPLQRQALLTTLLDALENRVFMFEHSSHMAEQIVMAIFNHRFGCFPGEKGNCPTEPLAEFGRIVCGKTPSKEVKEYFGGSIPFIKIPDMHSRVFLTHGRETLSHEGAAALPGRKIPPGSICVSCIATVGVTAITGTHCFTNQQINTVIPRHPRERYYLYCRLKTMKPYLEALATAGSASANVSTGRFSQIRIPRPPRPIMEKFHCSVEPFFRRILLDTCWIEHLTAVKNTLLPRLIKGR